MVSQREIGSVTQKSKGTGGLVSIVSYSRPSLMIIALVGAFNQEKALVGAFSVIVKTGCVTDGSFTALLTTHPSLSAHFCTASSRRGYLVMWVPIIPIISRMLLVSVGRVIRSAASCSRDSTWSLQLDIYINTSLRHYLNI